MTTKERIIQYVDYKRLSKKEFYEINQLKRGLFDNDKLKQSVSDIFIAKIIENHKDLNVRWLLTGEGNMLLEDEKKEKQSSSSNNYSQVPTQVIEINPEMAKSNTLIADVRASAGFGAIVTDHKKLEQLPSIHLPNAPLGLNVAFQIMGDSMHPTIRNMDFVAGNQITDPKEIQEGYTYILIDRYHGVLCKRLYKLGDDWQIVSDNPLHKPYNRAKEDVMYIFKAFCRWSYDFRNSQDDVRNRINSLELKVEKLERHILEK